MGLDMYATKIKRPDGAEVAPVDFEGDARLFTVTDGVRDWAAGVEHEEIAYWRKHPNLHGWMKALYERKGGSDEQFNCSYLRLDEADLDALEEAVRGDNLPHTEGFFFGKSDPSDAERDLRFIIDARRALADGWIVAYSAWW